MRLGLSIGGEDVLSAHMREAVARGADILVNLADDSRFTGPLEPLLRSRAARFRAVENRRPLLRVSNAGPTEVVGRDGLIRDGCGLRADGRRTGFSGVLRVEIPLSAPEMTFYSKAGDFFAGACLVAAGLALLAAALGSLRAPGRDGRRRRRAPRRLFGGGRLTGRPKTS